ncbi:MAG: DUF5050 domain-containing protein, partial [Solirubrobacterales bacterium]
MKRYAFLVLFLVTISLTLLSCSNNGVTKSQSNDVKNTQGNTSGNIINHGIATQQGDCIYFTNGRATGILGKRGCLYKINTDGTCKTRLTVFAAPRYVNVVG